MSLKVFISPQKYVQGPGALSLISDHLEVIGIKNPLVLASPSGMKACKETISDSLNSKGMQCSFIEFGRVCSLDEIHRVRDTCLEGSHDAIISCGGGSAMDTGRGAAAGPAICTSPFESFEKFGADVPCIQVPTVAATDAPTASVSVIYTNEGIYQGALLVRRNPALVLADTQVIARAPARTLVAGMGDALATCFEADVSRRTATTCLAGGLATQAAQKISFLTFEILMKYGVQAKLEAEANIPGPALEAVIEANILLSGLGYESGGLGAAHAIATSMTSLQGHFDPEPYHGELVAFSTLAQLIMEEREPDLLDEVIYFCESVGLPTCFEEIGLKKPTHDLLSLVADGASKNLIIRSMPQASQDPDGEGRFYDPVEILNSIKLVDAYTSKNRK